MKPANLGSEIRPRVAIVGPVYPYRAGIAYCTTRLARELGADAISFKRQYPKRFYPGGDDIDPTLPRADAEFLLDILNPITWLRGGWRLRKYDAVIFVWWIWVWALPYLTIIALLRRGTNVILQCHNIGDKEPAWWKSMLTNRVLRRGRVLVVHAESELQDAVHRAGGRRVVKAHLPAHELGGAMPPRHEAKRKLGLEGKNVALFFGHIRPFKGLDIAVEAWKRLKVDTTLLVAGEPWWDTNPNPESRIPNPVVYHLRFIPDSEIASYFSAADVVLAPYRIEAQSGVALTAFHFARPVIASRVGGLPELVRDGVNGYLIPTEDPEALARAVDRFFTEADRPAMERAAAETAKANSWEDYGRLFTRLVERP
ncbi:MAG TPA: glycosyltransferase [Thermoanaerobaculia bacterium]|nr:glycosyltransferase [Thermoanaerobaculia bacterium]